MHDIILVLFAIELFSHSVIQACGGANLWNAVQASFRWPRWLVYDSCLVCHRVTVHPIKPIQCILHTSDYDRRTAACGSAAHCSFFLSVPEVGTLVSGQALTAILVCIPTLGHCVGLISQMCASCSRCVKRAHVSPKLPELATPF